MITVRQLVTVAALCGAAVLAGSSFDWSDVGPFTSRDTATPIEQQETTRRVISSSAEVEPSDVTGSLGETTPSASASATETAAVEPPVADFPSTPSPEPPVRLLSAFPSKAAADDPLPPVPPLEVSRECLEAETCVDEYLWALYQRAPKVDTNKIIERVKKAVKKDGKMRTIFQTITNYVIGDFTWKDPDAAQRAGMPLKDYVIGGMDPGFKLKLFRALRIMDDAGFMPAITSAFRDDYRQSIANGNKAASDSSYHGGSRRGGFGHGLAADLVSVKGETRKERLASSDVLWKWIDAHEKELGIGRPYRDRDPPHVGPLDGKEYIEKRAAAEARKAVAKTKVAKAATAATAETKKPEPTALRKPSTTKHTTPEKSSKVSSLQTLTAER